MPVVVLHLSDPEKTNGWNPKIAKVWMDVFFRFRWQFSSFQVLGFGEKFRSIQAGPQADGSKWSYYDPINGRK